MATLVHWTEPESEHFRLAQDAIVKQGNEFSNNRELADALMPLFHENNHNYSRTWEGLLHRVRNEAKENKPLATSVMNLVTSKKARSSRAQLSANVNNNSSCNNSPTNNVVAKKRKCKDNNKTYFEKGNHVCEEFYDPDDDYTLKYYTGIIYTYILLS